MQRRRNSGGGIPEGSRYYGGSTVGEGSNSDVLDEIGTRLRFYIQDARAEGAASIREAEAISLAWSEHDLEQLYRERLIPYERTQTGDLTWDDGERIKDAIDHLMAQGREQIEYAAYLSELWKERNWDDLYMAGAISEGDYNFVKSMREANPVRSRTSPGSIKRRLV